MLIANCELRIADDETSNGVMHVSLLRVELRIPESQSLKAKRSVLKRLVARLEAMKVAVSEVANQDKWQAATLGIAVVAPQPGRVDEVAASVERALYDDPRVEVVAIHREHAEAP